MAAAASAVPIGGEARDGEVTVEEQRQQRLCSIEVLAKIDEDNGRLLVRERRNGLRGCHSCARLAVCGRRAVLRLNVRTKRIDSRLPRVKRAFVAVVCREEEREVGVFLGRCNRAADQPDFFFGDGRAVHGHIGHDARLCLGIS